MTKKEEFEKKFEEKCCPSCLNEDNSNNWCVDYMLQKAINDKLDDIWSWHQSEVERERDEAFKLGILADNKTRERAIYRMQYSNDPSSPHRPPKLLKNMGTNYYLRTKKCETCGHKADRLHLGKLSAGWAFLIQANGFEHYYSWNEMKKWLKGKQIEDEYGDKVNTNNFIKMVENRKDIPDPEPADYGSGFLKIAGYKFYDRDFS